jgi:hypothetical protein
LISKKSSGSETAWPNESKLGRKHPVSLTFHSALRKLNTELSIGASHQVLVHLAKQFQRRRFLEINQSEKRLASFPNELKFSMKHLWKVLYKDW